MINSMTHDLKKILALLLTVCLAVFFGCQSINVTPSQSLKIKRGWTRKLLDKDSNTKTSVAQNASPVFYDSSIIAGSSFGGLHSIDKFGRKKLLLKLPEGVSALSETYSDFIFIGSQLRRALGYNLASNEILWSTDLDSAPESFSQLDNGQIFTQTESGTLYALNASDGAINWKSSSYGSLKSLSIKGSPQPIVHNDFVISSFPSGDIVKFNKKNGQIVWQLKLSDGTNYSDVQYLHLLKSDNSVFAGVFDEAVYKISLDKGQVLWQAFEKPVSAFAFDSGSFYFSSAGGELVKLKTSTGTQELKAKIFKGLGNRPSVIGNRIIAVDSKGPVYSISKKDFKDLVPLYEFLHQISAPPLMNAKNNSLYILSNKSYLFQMKVVQ